MVSNNNTYEYNSVSNKHVYNTIVTLAYLFSFTPFFSFYPLSSDLQPLFLLPIVLLFILGTKIGHISYGGAALLLLFIASLMYIDINKPSISVKTLGILAAFFSYQFYIKYSSALNQKILFYIVLINFVALFIHYIEPVFFSETLGKGVRVIKTVVIDGGGSRGASGFSAEPGFMGSLSVFYISVSLWLKDVGKDNKYFYRILFLSICMIVMTKSGSGFLFLFLFLFIYYIRFNIISIICCFLIIFSFILSVNIFDFGRGGYIIKLLFNDPARLFFTDASVGHRVINIFVGILSLSHYPLGVGSGGYNEVFNNLDLIYNISGGISGDTTNISAFAKYATELGLLYYFFLCYFIYRSIHGSRCWNPIPYLVLALIYHSASFSISFPPVWFLFAIMHDKKKVVSRKSQYNDE
jgi:hypothetical protein